MSLGERLKKARQLKKLTQVDAARTLGIDDTTISKYENDKSEPDLETLNKLANLYGVKVESLMSDNKNIPSFANKKDISDLGKFLEQPEVNFDGMPLTDEDRAKLKGFMEHMFWDAKKRNKRKRDNDDK